jgi:hypothetical protein
MSKYGPLGDFLRLQSAQEVPLTFEEIESLTGVKLPPSARYRAWWSNNSVNSAMTRVWLDAGFETAQVDMSGRKLVFRRARDPGLPRSGRGIPPPPAGRRHPLFGALKGLLRIMPGTDLTQPANPDWGKDS